MKFSELLEYCESEAILGKLENTELVVWRYICRSYSKKFNTPLHIVMHQLPPEDVILAHYESELDDYDIEENAEKILDMVYTLQDPEYATQKREELSDDIKRYEEEELERIKTGRPIHKALKNEYSPLGPDLPNQKTLLDAPKVEQKKGPSGGHIDLSYMEDDESGGGFRE